MHRPKRLKGKPISSKSPSTNFDARVVGKSSKNAPKKCYQTEGLNGKKNASVERLHARRHKGPAFDRHSEKRTKVAPQKRYYKDAFGILAYQSKEQPIASPSTLLKSVEIKTSTFGSPPLRSVRKTDRSKLSNKWLVQSLVRRSRAARGKGGPGKQNHMVSELSFGRPMMPLQKRATGASESMSELKLELISGGGGNSPIQKPPRRSIKPRNVISSNSSHGHTLRHSPIVGGGEKFSPQNGTSFVPSMAPSRRNRESRVVTKCSKNRFKSGFSRGSDTRGGEAASPSRLGGWGTVGGSPIQDSDLAAWSQIKS